MKKNLSWQVLLLVTIVVYFLQYLIGGVVGDALGVLGLLTLLFTIIAGFRVLFQKKESK